MFHAECKPGYHKSQRAWATEPCSKKMKSTDEPYGKSYDGLQRLYEEVHVKKTHSGFIPLSLSDEEQAQQENEIAEVLDPSKQKFSGKKIVSTEPSDSVRNAEVISNADGNSPFFTSNADAIGMRDNNTSIGERKNEGDTELYSTSKAFIGPIYKSETHRQPDGRKKTHSNNCPEVLGATLGRSTKKKMTPKQAVPCDVPKIEDELSQFYSEINQLENDDHSTDLPLQEYEVDSRRCPVEYNNRNHIVCVNPQDWSYSRTSADSGSDGQCFYNRSNDQRRHSEQPPYSDPKYPRIDNGQCFDDGRKVWEAEQLHNKEAGSRFWNDCVPQFKSGWQHTHPFIIPYGPLPPQFTPHFNFQKLNSSSHQSDTFYPSNAGPFENTPVNMSNSTSDQNSEYASHFGIPSTETPRNGYNVPDGQMDNGFCETKACWKDPKISSSVSQQLPDSMLCESESQKVLFILRGLPGSGKTTLARILLGQSRDGIVFSTDDYFRQQDGYWSYNVGQLGAAHEWNQKRAKQAMHQGRSPIIIDNTNTQAWEMKPYVEAALENGYKVEFHEPSTWWKFDSGELEKRNEHGVSREKIIQMLERYDYQISIPIIMNSVVPFYKTSQRPQRRQREAVVKKRHRLRKMKQRRKLKRNKEMKAASVKAVEKSPHDDFTPSDEDSSQGGGEDSEGDGTAVFVTGQLNEPKEGSESASDNGLKAELQKGSLISEMVNPPSLDNSLKTGVLSGDSRCSLSLPSIPNENITEQSGSDHLSDGIQSNIFVKNKNSIWAHSNQSSDLKMEYCSKEASTVFQNTEGKAAFARPLSKSSAENQVLGNEKEGTISCEHKASKNEKNTRTFTSFDSVDKQAHTSSDKSEACLTWPENASMVIYDQRFKKLRRPKKVSERTTELTDYKSDKEPKRDCDTDLLHVNDIIDSAVPLMLTDNINKISCIEIDDISTESVAKANVPSGVCIHPSDTNMHPSRKKGRYKRTFKLAPRFDIPRQIAVGIDEKLLQDEVLVIEQEESSNEIPKKNKQALGSYGCPEPSRYDAVIESSPPDIKPLLCNDPKQPAKESMDLSNNIAASPVQINTSASCKAPLPTEGQVVTVDETLQVNAEEKWGKISLDVLITPPDILHSIHAVAECPTDCAVENIEQMQQINETKPKKYSQIDGGQDSLSTKSSILKLPLSLGFALQLVELFGSPGVSLDTLLPHDYVVPLDWATSKEIHLQWKTSVEKKQNKNQSKEDSSLPVGVDALEDSSKDGQESQVSSEAVP